MSINSAGSYLKTLAGIVARGVRDRRAGSGRPVVPRQRLVAERWKMQVEPRQLAKYIAVTEGRGIPDFEGPGAVLPPVYPAVWEATLCMELLARPEMPSLLGGVVHLDSESVPLRPLRLGDTILCRMELENSEPDPRGIRCGFVSRNWNESGQLCSENRMTVLLRAPGGGKGERPAPPADSHREDRDMESAAGWEEIGRWALRGNRGRRYARVSGDYNPIHLWALTARAFGFRRPILHGFCTQALVAHALIRHYWNGDPARLRKLRIRFRAPVLLPAVVSLQSMDGEGSGRFRVVVGEEGKVCVEGSFLGK